MKASPSVGDLVRFNPGECAPGALTAMKYIKRMYDRFDGGRVGLVISIYEAGKSRNCLVQVGEHCIVINTRFLEVLSV